MKFSKSIKFAATAMACIFSLVGQAQTDFFQKTYYSDRNNGSSHVLETAQGYLLVGNIFVTDYETDALAMLVDKKGEVIWQKSYGGSGSDEFNYAVPANDGGGYILSGYSIDSLLNLADAWLLKIDENGELLWQKSIGMLNKNEFANGPILPIHDGYLLSGLHGNSLYSSRKTFLTRVNNAGETVWSHAEYTSAPTTPTFGNFQFLHGDSVFLCGGGGGTFGFWMMRDTATGLANVFQAFDGGNFETVETLKLHPSGGFIMSGATNPQAPGSPINTVWMQRLSHFNAPATWTKTYRVQGWQRNYHTMEVLPDGSIMMALGNFESEAILAKINPDDGQVAWAKSFSGEGTPTNWIAKILPTSDGSLLLLGNQLNTQDSIKSGIWLVKTDLEGRSPLCCNVEKSIEAMDIVVPKIDNAQIAGENFVFSAPSKVADSSKNLNLVANDYCDLPRPNLNVETTFCPGESVVVNGQTFSESGETGFYIPSNLGSGCDTFSHVVLTLLPNPVFTDTLLFFAGDTVFINGSPHTQAGVVLDTIASLSGGCDTLATYFLEMGVSAADPVFFPGNLKFHPNPVVSETEIRLENRVFKNGEIEFFDLGGRLVYATEFVGDRVVFRREVFANGLYFLKVFEGGRLVGLARLVFVQE